MSLNSLHASGNIGGGLVGMTPAAEQLSLQHEAAMLLNDINRAHSALDDLLSVGQPNAPAPSDMPTLATAINVARTRMAELVQRVEHVQRLIGQI